MDNNKEDNEGYVVKLEYFKQSGKLYTEGEYVTKQKHMYAIFEEIRKMKSNSTLPGIDGNEWIIHVSVPEYPHNFPQLIL